jgi:hypothetical protein
MDGPRNGWSRTLSMAIAPTLDAAILCVSLTPEESQQVGVDLILMRRREAGRRARLLAP